MIIECNQSVYISYQNYILNDHFGIADKWYNIYQKLVGINWKKSINLQRPIYLSSTSFSS